MEIAIINNVRDIQSQQTILSFYPKARRSGMKLTDTYKIPNLFEKFRISDIDEDGVISEKNGII